MGESDGASIQQLFWNQQGVWSGRGDLNARPPAPKACGFSRPADYEAPALARPSTNIFLI